VWTSSQADAARDANDAGCAGHAAAAIDRVGLGVRQLHRIARQEGARPDYSLQDAMPSKL
jgi:hypothetical protein